MPGGGKLVTIYRCHPRAFLLTEKANWCKIIAVKVYIFVKNADIDYENHLYAGGQKERKIQLETLKINAYETPLTQGFSGN